MWQQSIEDLSEKMHRLPDGVHHMVHQKRLSQRKLAPPPMLLLGACFGIYNFLLRQQTNDIAIKLVIVSPSGRPWFTQSCWLFLSFSRAFMIPCCYDDESDILMSSFSTSVQELCPMARQIHSSNRASHLCRPPCFKHSMKEHALLRMKLCHRAWRSQKDSEMAFQRLSASSERS